MNNYRLINNLLGWVVFVISVTVYALTLEPSVSLWDCGEFISAAYRLQVVHPPGAPLFLLVGRFFALFAGDNLQMVPVMVNMLSAVASALTCMFTFWIITHLGRKIMVAAYPEENTASLSTSSLITVMGAGLVGSLAVTFMDSFWFSAVEAEVYASSSFFTALTFWAIFKWENVAHEPGSDRWLIFIAYTIGLAIGVHLLNLLVIPAVAYVYYFKRYKYTLKGFLAATGIGAGILLFIQVGIIPGIPSMAAFFDRIFKNGFNMPFWTGAFFFLFLLVGAVVIGIIYSHKRRKVMMNTAFISLAFIIMGYSSYSTVVIRSMSNPAIDMNDPEDLYNLVSYINREQYGDRPLLRGPYYNAQPSGIDEGAMQYRKGTEEYEEIDVKREYSFKDEDKTFFPRMGDMQKEGSGQGYRLWSGAKEGRKPTFAQNLKFFWNYQLGYMYWRYFMWNFAGRQNDEQGMIGEPTRGNWISGIPFIDDTRLGPQGGKPESLKMNRANNKYFLLPLIIGILGAIFHYRTQRKDAAVVLTLFLFTGILMIIYLNQPPFEPRERDYASVGSFQTFCIWIGIGVIAIADFLRRKMSSSSAAALSTGACLLAAPVLMGAQGWDDHDRSKRYLAIDFAIDYLESCDKNAILFTNGDNDTYPLWYAQNVEGIRTDVRIINLSLLSTDWYANALKRKVFDSEPLPMSMPSEKYVSGVRDYIRYGEDPTGTVDPNKYYNLKDIVNWICSDNPKQQMNGQPYYPTKKFAIPVDKDKVIKNGTVAPQDIPYIQDQVLFEYDKPGMYKGTLVVLDILATNNWERPIYFTTTTGSDVYMRLQPYFRLEGLTYRLTPVKRDDPVMVGDRSGLNAYLTPEVIYPRLMNKFKFGGMEHGKIWVDEKATLVPNQLRILYAQTARSFALRASQGAKDTAEKLLDYSREKMPENVQRTNGNVLAYMADIYYIAGKNNKGRELLNFIAERAFDEAKYYMSFNKSQRKGVQSELEDVMSDLYRVQQVANDHSDADAKKMVEDKLNQLQTMGVQ